MLRPSIHSFLHPRCYIKRGASFLFTLSPAQQLPPFSPTSAPNWREATSSLPRIYFIKPFSRSPHGTIGKFSKPPRHSAHRSIKSSGTFNVFILYLFLFLFLFIFSQIYSPYFLYNFDQQYVRIIFKFILLQLFLSF